MMMLVELIHNILGIYYGTITLGFDGTNKLYKALEWEYRVATSNNQEFYLLGGIDGFINNFCVRWIHLQVHKSS